ncbi:MAG: hypothetical protein ACFFCP_00350 [Promethearchaeota archaeon]
MSISIRRTAMMRSQYPVLKFKHLRDVYFDINVYDIGNDSVKVTIHAAIYEIDQTTFDSISTGQV